MDIMLTEEQKLIFHTALEFVQGVMTVERARELDARNESFDHELVARMAKLGWLGLPLAPEFGGSGLGMMELTLLIEACGHGAVPNPLFATLVEAALLLQDGGSAIQKREWLPRVAKGLVVLTVALMEKFGGYGPESVRTEVIKSGSGWRIRGTKVLVRDAATADAIICAARSGQEPADLTLLLVPRAAAGVSIRQLPASGEPLYEVRFDDVEVPSEAVIGEPRGGWPLISKLLLRGAAMKAAELTGIGQAALNLTIEYAKNRIQFGRPIGTFQAIHHHCADMYRDVVACRLLAYQAACCLDISTRAEREVAIAKAKASEAVPAVTRMAHQIHGGTGYYTGYPLERLYQRAVAAQSAYGNAAYHYRRLASILRGDLKYFLGTESHELPVHHVPAER